MKKGRDFDVRGVAVFQKSEITEHEIYKNLAGRVRGLKSRRILSQIADDEMRHYNVWKTYTRQDVAPSRIRVWLFTVISVVFGFTFAIKLMENSEKRANHLYTRFPGSYKEVNGIIRDEEEHEQALQMLFDEERLQYTGTIILALSNALVELMGVLAGLTFVLQNSRAVALTASITGIAAALSMGASSYLATKSEQGGKNPLVAAFSTGFAYILTVLLLIAPYFLFNDLVRSFGVSLFVAVVIIGLFNYYISVVRLLSFKSRFLEMAGLSAFVAALSFLAGYLIRFAFGPVI